MNETALKFKLNLNLNWVDHPLESYLDPHSINPYIPHEIFALNIKNPKFKNYFR